MDRGKPRTTRKESSAASDVYKRKGPGRPIPSMHRPQEIFNRLFKPYAGKEIEQVRADP